MGDLGRGVGVSLRRASPVTHEASGPGEVSGPAVDLELVMMNGSRLPVDLDAVTVTMTHGPEERPAIPVTSSGEPFRGALGLGESASGRYRFLLPPDEWDDVRILINYSAEEPTAILVGPIPSWPAN
jgi:hypothetical protein